MTNTNHEPNRRHQLAGYSMLDVYEKMEFQMVKGGNYIELNRTDYLIGGVDISMKEMSGQTLAVLAPFASGPTTSARLAQNFGNWALKSKIQDGLTVYPGTPQAATLDSYNDHRVAVSLALIGTAVPGIVIRDPGCVSKTCTTYFELLLQLGISVEYVI